MATTPTYAFPIPELADTPDVPRDIGALANAVDDALADAVAVAHVGRGTTLPSAPTDGQLFEWVIDDANGVQWLMRYNAAAPTYKWEFVGGPELQLRSDVEAAGATAPAYSPSGPTLTIPHGGLYQVAWGALMYCGSGPGGIGSTFMGLLNGSSPVASHRAAQAQITAGQAIEASSVWQGLLAKSAVIQPGTALQSGTTGSSAWRWVRVRPLRVAND